MYVVVGRSPEGEIQKEKEKAYFTLEQAAYAVEKTDKWFGESYRIEREYKAGTFEGQYGLDGNFYTIERAHFKPVEDYSGKIWFGLFEEIDGELEILRIHDFAVGVLREITQLEPWWYSSIWTQAEVVESIGSVRFNKGGRYFETMYMELVYETEMGKDLT